MLKVVFCFGRRSHRGSEHPRLNSNRGAGKSLIVMMWIVFEEETTRSQDCLVLCDSVDL